MANGYKIGMIVETLPGALAFLYPSIPDGLTDQFAGIIELFFVEHIFSVCINGLLAYIQSLTDFLAQTRSKS